MNTGPSFQQKEKEKSLVVSSSRPWPESFVNDEIIMKREGKSCSEFLEGSLSLSISLQRSVFRTNPVQSFQHLTESWALGSVCAWEKADAGWKHLAWGLAGELGTEARLLSGDPDCLWHSRSTTGRTQKKNPLRKCFPTKAISSNLYFSNKLVSTFRCHYSKMTCCLLTGAESFGDLLVNIYQ